MDDVQTWDDRFRTMRWPDDIDLLRQFDVVLAQRQPDGRFASRWFDTCDEAAWAGPYWESGLATGLLGLRKVRNANDVQPESRVATALAHFAALSIGRGTDSLALRTAFRRHAAALTALYPRHDSHWKSIWADALATLDGFESSDRRVVRNEWLERALPAQRLPDYDQRKPASKRTADQRAPGRAELPRRRRLDQVVERFEDVSSSLDEALWRSARDLIRGHWEYARVSHHSHFAVRTTHNLCDRMLRKQPSASQLEEIHDWTLRTIRAEAGNAYAWDLWAKVLAAVGAREASLDVRWEAVRRFPHNIVVRTALVVALVDRGNHVLAERLFRETLQDFPNDAIRPQSLSEQLSPQNEWREARAALSAIREGDPDNSYAVSFLKAISDEQVFGVNGPFLSPGRAGTTDFEPRVDSYLQSLSGRSALMEAYFAPSTNGASGPVMDHNERPLDQLTSELELVVAYRTGRRQGRSSNGLLDLWAQARPGSYSAQLLLLSRGIDVEGADQEGMLRIGAEFPQHRAWNEWLGYAFVRSPRRSELRRTARDEQFWGGRLEAVYPHLAVRYDRSLECRPEALRRLFEDVALATAEVGLPPAPLGDY